MILRKISVMETNQASMLVLLESHADAHGDTLAHLLPGRDITYRRLWSRIERGSARLQGEWGVKPGDLVAYAGNGHPDAIVLYFSLLRIGASLLPLEAMSEADMNAALDAMHAVLVIHDDELCISHRPAQRLDDLLSVWSHHDPVLTSDQLTRRALWLPDGQGQWQPGSLLGLCAALPAVPRSTFIADRIFTADLLTNVVLPSLRDACLMQFAATDSVLKSGF